MQANASPATDLPSRAIVLLVPYGTAGHVVPVDKFGRRLDSTAGPLDFMARVWLSAGFRVFDPAQHAWLVLESDNGQIAGGK